MPGLFGGGGGKRGRRGKQRQTRINTATSPFLNCYFLEKINLSYLA